MTSKYAAGKLNGKRIARRLTRVKKAKPRRDQFKLGFIAACAVLHGDRPDPDDLVRNAAKVFKIAKRYCKEMGLKF